MKYDGLKHAVYDFGELFDSVFRVPYASSVAIDLSINKVHF